MEDQKKTAILYNYAPTTATTIPNLWQKRIYGAIPKILLHYLLISNSGFPSVLRVIFLRHFAIWRINFNEF